MFLPRLRSFRCPLASAHPEKALRNLDSLGEAVAAARFAAFSDGPSRCHPCAHTLADGHSSGPQPRSYQNGLDQRSSCLKRRRAQTGPTGRSSRETAGRRRVARSTTHLIAQDVIHSYHFASCSYRGSCLQLGPRSPAPEVPRSTHGTHKRGNYLYSAAKASLAAVANSHCCNVASRPCSGPPLLRSTQPGVNLGTIGALLLCG